MSSCSEKRECPACNTGDFRSLGYNIPDYEYRVSYTVRLLCCEHCGLVRHESIPGYDRLHLFYPEDYLVYNSSFKSASNALYAKLKNKLYSMRAKKTARYIGQTGNILDVGCANGAFLINMKQFGHYGLYGLDIKNTGVNFEEHSINFKEGYLEDLEYPAEFFNAVILDNVLEHVPDPIVFMKKVISVIKPGGYIIGTTPNFNSLDRFFFQHYWGGFHIPRHIYIFNARNLRMFMNNLGITDIKYPVTTNAADWAVSVQNFMRRKQKKQGKYNRASYFSFIAMVFAPLALLSSIFNLNGVMDFICVYRR